MENRNIEDMWVVEDVANHKMKVWYSYDYVTGLIQRILELENKVLELKEGK